MVIDTIRRLMSYFKYRSVEVIKKPGKTGVEPQGGELYKIINNKWKGVEENF
jgi:hypothetical protein